MDSLITTIAADAIIAADPAPPASERVPLSAAIGRVLSSPVFADRDLPPYPRAMMDGFAITRDLIGTDGKITAHGLHAAGDPPPPPLPPGRAWEIMTGACIPADCIAVVPYEDVGEDRVVNRSIRPGQFIHAAGSDARAGDLLLAAPAHLGPAEVAIAASVGVTELSVAAKPRIALASTGNEAVPVDARPEPWQIRRSNGPMLDALLRHLGHPPATHHHIPDDGELARPLVRAALADSDLVILCGGISKGKRDLIRPILEETLGPPAFHGVRQRPGKPLAFWPGPPLIFALPGNPVSVLATFTRYVLPTLDRIAGIEPVTPRRPCPATLHPLPDFNWLVALDASGRPLVPQNSGDFVSIAGVSGFLEVPALADGDAPSRFFPFTTY